MKSWKWSSKILVIGFAVALLGGCAEGPYYGPPAVAPGPPEVAPGPSRGFLDVGPMDRFYVMSVENNTPFEVRFHRANRALYENGYERVGGSRRADFEVNIALFQEARDNPDLRGQQMLGGAALGAAAGALIGAMAHAPVTGAIAGAAGGGFLGAAAPAATPVVRIDVHTHSFRTGRSSHRTVFMDMAHVPPYDVPRVLDYQVARMVGALPRR
ncbi:MAG: hypothetical protein P4L43_02900 [Syntrophobacteraceae bacterium]|nr:hypothetical protein [Syntrophobacteraceae bacterium]